MDNIIYKLEDIHRDIEGAIIEDRQEFLEKREEVLEVLNQIREVLEDE